MLLNRYLLQTNLVLCQKMSFVQRDVPCRKKENARRAPQFPVIYFVSLFTFSLCFHSLSYSCFNWFENCAGNFWVRKCSRCLGKANNPKVLSASSTTVCKLIFYTVSGENTSFLYFLSYLGASSMSLTIITIFFTCSSRMKLPPACLYISLSLNKCIWHLNAHSKIWVSKIAVETRQRSRWGTCAPPFSFSWGRCDSAVWGLSSEAVTCVGATRTLVQWGTAALALITKHFFVLTKCRICVAVK